MGTGLLRREFQWRRCWGRRGRRRIFLHGNVVDRWRTGNRLDQIAWNLGNSAQ
jgi:hypothetical protein